MTVVTTDSVKLVIMKEPVKHVMTMIGMNLLDPLLIVRGNKIKNKKVSINNNIYYFVKSKPGSYKYTFIQDGDTYESGGCEKCPRGTIYCYNNFYNNNDNNNKLRLFMHIYNNYFKKYRKVHS